MIGGFQVGPFQTDFQQVQSNPVPNVVMMDWYAACALLSDQNLIPEGPLYTIRHDVPPGYVVEQDPPAGSAIQAKLAIVLTVSESQLLAVAQNGVLPLIKQ